MSVSDLEQRVVHDLRTHGPANCRLIADRTGIDYASVTPRMKPLREKGLIAYATDSDGKRVRADRQNVYRATGAGE